MRFNVSIISIRLSLSMKKTGSPFLFLLCICIHFASAQTIQFNLTDTVKVIVNNDTLNSAWAGGINTPLFSEIDLNGDGIHDLFMFDKANNRISTFINDGTPGLKAWHYAPQYISKFPPVIKWALLYDYNCDGRADFFTLAPSTSGIRVYRNDFDSAQGGLRFTLVADEVKEEFLPGGFHAPIFASAVTMPSFGDVDGDGDMDILGFSPSPDGRLWYHKNYSMEHYGVCDSLDFEHDTETWGEFAVSQLNGGNTHISCFGCRHAAHPSGSDELVNYDQSAAAPRDDSIFSIFMIDIDGDGDKELLIGDSGADNSLLVLNGRTTAIDSMVSEQILFPDTVTPALFCTFHFHAYIDVDNDGIKDLLVEPGDLENLHSVWIFKNTGTNSVPHFVLQTTSFLVDQMIDVGEGACPVLFDADGDGLLDLVVGNYGVFQCGPGTEKSGLHLYKNTGSLALPQYQLVDSDYAGINSLFITGPIYPAFGDMNGDGNKDMIIGEADGKLQYFNNSGVPANFQLTGVNYMGIDVGSASTPQIIDLNRDGLLDLVIGAQNGHINYYENIGTAASPLFSAVATNNTLGGIIIHSLGSTTSGYTVPYFFYLQNHIKLLVGCEGGEVYLYDSIDNNLNGIFHLADSIIDGTQGIRPGFNLAVSGGDLNNDGYTDMLLGIYTGGVCMYLQKDPNVGVQQLSSHETDLLVAPNPVDEQCVVEIFGTPPSEKKQLNMMNIFGQMVFSKIFSSDRFVFNTHELPAGIYILQVSSSGNTMTRKLVVKH